MLSIALAIESVAIIRVVAVAPFAAAVDLSFLFATCQLPTRAAYFKIIARA